jgi:hypothetical protein
VLSPPATSRPRRPGLSRVVLTLAAALAAAVFAAVPALASARHAPAGRVAAGDRPGGDQAEGWRSGPVHGIHRNGGRALGFAPEVPSSWCTGSCSLNWSGWDVGSGTGNGFQGVKANWNAPCTTGGIDSQEEYTSWVGLGGFYGQPREPLEQAGIFLQPDGTYRMFWEYVAKSAGIDNQQLDQNDVVTCGNHLSAWVYYGNSSGYCPAGQFRMHVQDTSTGKPWDSGCMTGQGGAGIQSAEWVDERPAIYATSQCSGQASTFVYQLADYQWTDWSNVLAQANYNGASWKNPNNFTNSSLDMIDNTLGIDLSYPDQYSIGSNDIFTDRWYANGTFCDYPPGQ